MWIIIIVSAIYTSTLFILFSISKNIIYFNLILIGCETTFSIFDKSISTSEFKKLILNNISSYIDSSTIINCSDFKAQIISSDELDPKEQIKNGISGINLGNCIEVLKGQYNIPNADNLIIVEIETKEDKEKNKDLDINKDVIDLGKNVELAIYDYSGNKLDMSFCEEEITIMKYIGDLENVNILEAIGLAEQGIDVFNASDSFFTDICYPYTSEQNTDVILSDRREDLYQNVSFCGDECIYDGIDYELMAANCICDASLIQIDDGEEKIENNEDKKGITLNDLTKTFRNNLLEFNYIVILCYNLVFDREILIKNIGFFVLLSMNSLQIVFLIIFSIKCLKPIRNYMLVFEPFDPNIDPPNPPPKSKNLNSKIREIIEDNIDNKNMNKKEKEIKKTILINNLIQSNKKRKESNNNSNINNSSENDDVIVIDYLNSEESSNKNSNIIQNYDLSIKDQISDKNYYINESEIDSENIKAPNNIYLNLNDKNMNLSGKRNKKKENNENNLNLKNIPYFGSYNTSSKKSRLKDTSSKKSSTIFSYLFPSKSNIKIEKKQIKNFPNLKKIKLTNNNNSDSKSERHIIMEKNEEEENYEKINKKQKKNIKKDTVKNALKEGLAGNQLKSDFYISNLYHNKNYLKKNDKNNNKNRNNNEINKNNEIQTTSFKKKK